MYLRCSMNYKDSLSRHFFLFHVKQILCKLGYNKATYSGHSFRIDAAADATAAAAAGIQDHLI